MATSSWSQRKRVANRVAFFCYPEGGAVRVATVAMNFALKDSMVERASGQTAEGGEPSEVTELWTFIRARGGNWLLSAIQQT